MCPTRFSDVVLGGLAKPIFLSPKQRRNHRQSFLFYSREFKLFMQKRSTFPVPSQATHASRYFESQRWRAEQKNDSCSRNRTNGLAVSACQLVACRRVTIFGGAVQMDCAPRNQRTSGLCVGCGGERAFPRQKL